MKVLVTGGTGFFGRALLRWWSERKAPGLQGAHFTLLSRDPDAFANQYGALLACVDARMHRGDVLEPDSLPRERDYTHVIHAAADSTRGPSLSPLARFSQIFDGTRNVLNWTRDCPGTRMLLVSSGGVYGKQPTNLERIPEDFLGTPDPLEAENAYSIAKRAAEHLSALYANAYGTQVVIARCFAFVGPDLPVDAHFAIGNFMGDALAGRPVTVRGDGAAQRSYLDQSDLAEWLCTLLLKGEAGRAYNVGSDRAISIGELAALVARIANSPYPVQVLGRPVVGQANGRNRYVPDIGRATNELGLRVTVPLEDAIASALDQLGSALPS